MKIKENLKQFGPILMLLFYFFIFARINTFITPYVQNFILSLGIFAPFGYIIIGLFFTVIATLGFGPLNITLQQTFGFFPSLLYFFSYTFIGLMINFSLSKIFGKKIVQFLLPEIKVNSKIGILNGINVAYSLFEKVMEKGNFTSFLVFLGGGDELLAYLAGTTNLKFKRFFIICFCATIINTLLYVGRNISFQNNNTVFFTLEVIISIFSFLSYMVICIGGDVGIIKSFFEKFKVLNKEYETKADAIKKKNSKDQKKELKELDTEFGKKFDELFDMLPHNNTK